MRSEPVLARRAVPHLLAVVLIVASGAALAQYDARPFDDDPVAISAAFGAEMAVLRLQAARALLQEGVDEDEIEEVLEGLELELLRFGAALHEADPELVDRAEDAFERAESAEDPDDLEQAIQIALEVRDAVSAPLTQDPAYASAVMTLLLVSESGVAEGWEEAVEGEVGPYAVAWAAMPRVYELWARLAPFANENQTFEIEDQLAALQALFENPTPPDMAGADPEEGEGAAVHVVGFLEDVTGAWMFPDRDLPALVQRTRAVVADGCSAFEAGDDRAGAASLAWAAFAFEEYLEGTLRLFAPEPTEEIDELLAPFSGEEDDEEDEEDDEDHDDEAFDPSSCEELLEAFDDAGAAFGL